MVKHCYKCQTRPAKLMRPKTLQPVCLDCFYELFETDVHETITKSGMFKKGDRIAIGASGGKDSTVLIHVLKLLNERYDYGLDLVLLSIDEGIRGEIFSWQATEMTPSRQSRRIEKYMDCL